MALEWVFLGKSGLAIFPAIAKIFGSFCLATLALSFIITVIGCFSNDYQSTIMQTLPGQDSDLLYFDDSRNFFAPDLKESWVNMREAKQMVVDGVCKFGLDSKATIADTIKTATNLGITNYGEKIDAKYREALDRAQATALGAINLIEADLQNLILIGADNGDYSGAAQPYFENGTKIYDEIASLVKYFNEGLQEPLPDFNSTVAKKLKELFEKRTPNEPQYLPGEYLQFSALTAFQRDDETHKEARKYSVFLYNSLVGRDKQGIIYDLYDLHVELQTAAETMQAEYSQLKISFEDAEKRINEKFDKLKEEKTERVDGFLLNGLAKEINALKNTFELGVQEGSPSLAKDFEKLKNELAEAGKLFGDAELIEGQKQEDYLHYSIEKLKKATALAGRVEKLSAELYEKLAGLKENSRKTYESLKEKTKNAFLSETCQKAKEVGDAAHLKTAGEALADYKYAISLLNLCAAVPSEFENFEENFEYLENLIVQLEGKADVRSEKSVLKSLEKQKDYLAAPQTQEKLEKLFERLRLKAAPVEKQVLQMRDDARDMLSTGRGFKENIGSSIEGFEKYGADFETSLNLEVFENVGTLFDKYSELIGKLGPQVEKESKRFLERQAKLTLLFAETPVCNEKSRATLLVKVKNPTSVVLAREGTVLQISPEFSESIYVKVSSLQPGEEVYSEHEVTADAGKCDVELESLTADENSAQWLVDLDIKSYTEQLYIEVGDEKILLSGDREGWTRKEHRRVTSDSPLIVSRDRTVQKVSDGLDRYAIAISLENAVPEELNKVYVTEHLGIDVTKIDCSPACAISEDKITFKLDKMKPYGMALLTAQYNVENVSFELNYTLAYLNYYVTEILVKQPNFTAASEYRSYLTIKTAAASGETKIVLADGKKLIGELKKILDKLEKAESEPQKNSTIDVETAKQIEETFTELNNKISNICQFASCSTLHALYDEANLNWKRKSVFNADPVTKELEKKTSALMKDFEKTNFDGLSALLEKFKEATELDPSLKLDNPVYSLSDYESSATKWIDFAKINLIINLPTDDESKLSQLAELPKEKVLEYLEGASSLWENLNDSLLMLKEAAKDELTRAKEDSKKADAYFEEVKSAEKAYASGEYNNAMAYSQKVPSVLTTKSGDFPVYLLFIPLVGVAGGFVYVLRRPKRPKIQPKSLKEVFYDEKE